MITNYKPGNELPATLSKFAPFFVYDGDDIAPKQPHIVAAMKNNDLAHVLRITLNVMVGFVHYPEIGKKIVCHDLLSPRQIPLLTLVPADEEYMVWEVSKAIPPQLINEPWRAELVNNPAEYQIMQDEKFLLAVRLNQDTEEVEIYCYKK